MADDLIARLRCSYADPPCESCTFCAARAEIERLRRWKTEATTVLAEWDAVWECAGKGTLGESKQRGVVAELGRLDDEIERLRSAGETLARAVATYCGDDAWADRALKAWEEARRG